MQKIDNNGFRQEIEAFNEGKMQQWLKEDNTQSVEVFEGTDENIKARTEAIGKPYEHKLSRGFKKAKPNKK